MLGGRKIGFIGAGRMAEALVRGLLRTGVASGDIAAYDPDEGRRRLFAEHLGVLALTSNTDIAKFADIIVLAVKPGDIGAALGEMGESLRADQLVISIAAGIPTSTISSRVASGMPVIRVMPNTPCLIGEGISAISPGVGVTPEHMELASSIFGAVGQVVAVPEDKIDAVTGLSGSGPAYVYMFIEALVDGGVRMGLPRQTALQLAAQTVSGSAKMVLESGEHPALLRDTVTSPGGTTIAGTARLEEKGFRSAVIEAVKAATERSGELGRK